MIGAADDGKRRRGRERNGEKGRNGGDRDEKQRNRDEKHNRGEKARIRRYKVATESKEQGQQMETGRNSASHQCRSTANREVSGGNT
jgi:hypothetical protein